MTVPVVATELHRRHDPPHEVGFGTVVTPVHERPERIDVIQAALLATGHDLVAPTRHGDGPLHAVHDPEMVRFLRRGYDRWRAAGGPEAMIPDTFPLPRWTTARRPDAALGEPGWWCFDTATPLVAGSYAAARSAVDVALTGADLVAGGAPAAYALCRPPGHHAGRDYFGGFCLCNNAAVAARYLAADARIAIVDVDFHHGNGTQDLFYRDPDVLYASIHGDPAHAFPYFAGFADEVGEGPGRGANHNLPLPPGTGAAAYLGALDQALDVVYRFAPELLVVSLGFDALAADPIATFRLTPDAYHDIGHRLGQLALPTLFVQEGGYAVHLLGEAARLTLEGFALGG